MTDYLNSLLAIFGFINVVFLAIVIGRTIWRGQYKTKAELGFLFVLLVPFNGALWSVALPYMGVNVTMIMWRISFSILLTVGLLLVFFAEDA